MNLVNHISLGAQMETFQADLDQKKIDSLKFAMAFLLPSMTKGFAIRTLDGNFVVTQDQAQFFCSFIRQAFTSELQKLIRL